MEQTAEQLSTYPKEFRCPDIKPLLFMAFIAVALIFLWARSNLGDAGFRYVLMRSVIVLPVFLIVYSRSEKIVFTLLSDGMNIGDKTLIPFDKINKVTLRKNVAWVFFSDLSGKEKKDVINFCDISKPSRSEAKSALIQWFHEHNSQTLITEE